MKIFSVLDVANGDACGGLRGLRRAVAQAVALFAAFMLKIMYYSRFVWVGCDAKLMLAATDLECQRGDRILFSGLSFSLQQGEILQVNGPNGSGKTTLLRALCGLMTPSRGEIIWRNSRIQALGEEYLQEIVYLGHLNGIKDDLTALENLLISGGLTGKPLNRDRARQALQRLGMETCDDLPTRLLSQGQKRRVALTRLVTAEARLWILDEPYTALDVAAVQTLQGIIRDHVTAGGMAVITTHQEVSIDDVPVRHLHLVA